MPGSPLTKSHVTTVGLIESSTAWYYSNAEIENAEELEVEYESHSLLWSDYISAEGEINKENRKIAEEKWHCRDSFAKS